MFNRVNSRSRGKYNRGVVSQPAGSVLVGVVVAMVVMGVLGAGMVSMLGSSAISEVRANFGERAYHLAESGFRFAASSLPHVNDPLLDLNKTYNVPSGGSFVLKLENITKDSGGTDYTTVAKTDENNNIPEGGSLELTGTPNLPVKYGAFRHKGSWYRYQGFRPVDGEDPATIRRVLPVETKRVVDVSQEINTGEDLSLAAGPAIPDEQGKFKYGNNEYYEYESYSDGVLKSITCSEGPCTFDFDPAKNLIFSSKFPLVTAADDEIVISPILRVESTGKYPASGLLAATRTVTYTWPGGLPSVASSGDDYGEGDELNLDILDGLDGTRVSLVGDDQQRFDVTPGEKDFEVVIHRNVGFAGDPNLRGIKIEFPNKEESGEDVDRVLLNINWWNIVDNEGNKIFDVNNAYQYQGKTLSYDMQIKIGVGDNPQYKSYLGGLSLRAESNDMWNNSFYGMSLFWNNINGYNSEEDYPAWLYNSPGLRDLAETGAYHLVFWKMTQSDGGRDNVIEVLASKPLDGTGKVLSSSKAVIDWSTIVFRIVEDGKHPTKENTVIGIVYNKNEKPRLDVTWPDDDLRDPDEGDPDKRDILEIYKQDDEPLLSTGGLEEISVGRPEIGFHVFADKNSQNVMYLADFRVRMSGAGGGERESEEFPYIPPVQN